jgi:hypothetical protein
LPAVSTACALNIVVLAPGTPIYLGSSGWLLTLLNLISTTPDGVMYGIASLPL